MLDDLPSCNTEAIEALKNRKHALLALLAETVENNYLTGGGISGAINTNIDRIDDYIETGEK